MTTILYVDDDHALTGLVGYALEREGYEVQAVSTGRAALRLLHTEPPDLVILDVTLPDIGGLTVLSVLRAVWPVPVIMLSGRAHDVDILASRAYGGVEYIVKPFSVPVLMARISAALRSHAEEACAVTAR